MAYPAPEQQDRDRDWSRLVHAETRRRLERVRGLRVQHAQGIHPPRVQRFFAARVIEEHLVPVPGAGGAGHAHGGAQQDVAARRNHRFFAENVPHPARAGLAADGKDGVAGEIDLERALVLQEHGLVVMSRPWINADDS